MSAFESYLQHGRALGLTNLSLANYVSRFIPVDFWNRICLDDVEITDDSLIPQQNLPPLPFTFEDYHTMTRFIIVLIELRTGEYGKEVTRILDYGVRENSLVGFCSYSLSHGTWTDVGLEPVNDELIIPFDQVKAVAERCRNALSIPLASSLYFYRRVPQFFGIPEHAIFYDPKKDTLQVRKSYGDEMKSHPIVKPYITETVTHLIVTSFWSCHRQFWDSVNKPVIVPVIENIFPRGVSDLIFKLM